MKRGRTFILFFTNLYSLLTEPLWKIKGKLFCFIFCSKFKETYHLNQWIPFMFSLLVTWKCHNQCFLTVLIQNNQQYWFLFFYLYSDYIFYFVCVRAHTHTQQFCSANISHPLWYLHQEHLMLSVGVVFIIIQVCH